MTQTPPGEGKLGPPRVPADASGCSSSGWCASELVTTCVVAQHAPNTLTEAAPRPADLNRMIIRVRRGGLGTGRRRLRRLVLATDALYPLSLYCI